MSLNWKSQGKWFSDSRDIGIVANNSSVSCLKFYAFTLNAYYKDNSTGAIDDTIEENIGEIVNDGSNIYLHNTSSATDTSTPVLNLSLDPAKGLSNGYPVRISMYLKTSSLGTDTGTFLCNFIKSELNGVEYTIKLENLKLNGFHDVYLTSTNTLYRIPSKEWFHFEMVFPECYYNYDPYNTSAYEIVPCELKVNGVTVATLDWPNFQLHNIEMQLFDTSTDGCVDIKDLTVDRVVEITPQNPLMVRIFRENIGKKIKLTAETLAYKEIDNTFYRKLVIIAPTGYSVEQVRKLKGFVFDNLIFNNCDTVWNKDTIYSDIQSEHVEFTDSVGNIYPAKVSYLEGRSGNESADYDPHMFFVADENYNYVRKYEDGSTISGEPETIAVNNGETFKYEISFDEPIEISKILNFEYNEDNFLSNGKHIIKIYKSDNGKDYSIEYAKILTATNSCIRVEFGDEDITDEDINEVDNNVEPVMGLGDKSYKITIDAYAESGYAGLNNFEFNNLTYIKCVDKPSTDENNITTSNVIFRYSGTDIWAEVSYTGTRQNNDILYDPAYLFKGCSARKYNDGTTSNPQHFGILAGSDNHLQFSITFMNFIPFNAIKAFKCKNYTEQADCLTASTINFKVYETEDFDSYIEFQNVNSTVKNSYYTVNIPMYPTKSVHMVFSNMKSGQRFDLNNIEIEGLTLLGNEFNDDGSGIINYYEDPSGNIYTVNVYIDGTYNAWVSKDSNDSGYYQFISSDCSICVDFNTATDDGTLAGKTMTISKLEDKEASELTFSVYEDGNLISSEDIQFDTISYLIP